MAFDNESWLPAGTVIGNPVRTTGGSADSTPPLTIVDHEPVDASIELTDTDKALVLNRFTTSERNAINATPGMIGFDETLGLFVGYDDSQAWNTLGGGGGGLIPVEVTAGPVQMSSNHAYYVDSLSSVDLNLPNLGGLGDTIKIVGLGVGSWVITQDTFDATQIRVGTNLTTLGAGGSLESTATGDTVIIESDGEIWIATNIMGNLLGT